MPHNEADTRAKLIDPALHKAGWTEDMIKREETAGTVEIIGGKPRRSVRRTDYTLRIKIPGTAQMVAVALIEAKPESDLPGHGLSQAKRDASIKRLNVPFAFSSNGHQFVEYDSFSGMTQAPQKMDQFPTPDQLRQRYEQGKGFTLDSELAKPIITPFPRGEASQRYYQDAAIRATLEKLATGKKRALLSLATGSGKTRIAVHLLKKIADAGQLQRALFLCDRDELRNQALAAFQLEFGSDAAAASTKKPEKNARVLIATYQTLGVDSEDGEAAFLTKHYPENYFSHIIIDECHRSAWGKWSEVLLRNPDAVQIGLTATPREFEYTEHSHESNADQEITNNNLKYFGDPVYQYSIGQGIEDGYLAAMRIIRTNTFINRYMDTERETGLKREDLADTRLTNAITGDALTLEAVDEHYAAGRFESQIMLPDRVTEWCRDLFNRLCQSGNPAQKTIIFCVRDTHADAVANELNNLYAEWCRQNNTKLLSDFAFKCTAAAGKDHLPDLRGSTKHHFIATTVDLLTTGVDVPPVTNIVFFKYVKSPIAFYQMVGRGTRLHSPTNKLMFNVHDYTNATRLFGAKLTSELSTLARDASEGDRASPDKDSSIICEGLTVTTNHAGTYILTTNDRGDNIPLTLEQYKAKLADKLLATIPDLDRFRETWIERDKRRALISKLPDSGRSPSVIRELSEMMDYDLYDVISEIGYRQSPKTRSERADSFEYKNSTWLDSMENDSTAVVKAIASQFAKGGTSNLESKHILQTPEIKNAGGLPALRKLGTPQDIFREVKRRIFGV